MLGIFQPDLPADLLPAGLVAGEFVLLWLTFVDTHLAPAAVVAPRRTSLVEAA